MSLIGNPVSGIDTGKSSRVTDGISDQFRDQPFGIEYLENPSKLCQKQLYWNAAAGRPQKQPTSAVTSRVPFVVRLGGLCAGARWCGSGLAGSSVPFGIAKNCHLGRPPSAQSSGADVMADRPALREDCPLGGTIRVHVHANSVGGVEPATSGGHSSVPPQKK